MDGTLLLDDATISPETHATLDWAISLGHQVIAVTGRSFRTCDSILRGFSWMNSVICSNGAYVYDLEARQITWERAIPVEQVKLAVETIRRSFPNALFGWENRMGMDSDPEFITATYYDGQYREGDEKIPVDSMPLYKLLARVDRIPAIQLQAYLRSRFANDFEISTSGAPFVELTARGTNKGTTLARYSELNGFPQSRVLAIGDNYNDMAMLDWAGVSVAMGNAVPDIQSLTNFTTASNSDHGVSQFLKSFLN